MFIKPKHGYLIPDPYRGDRLPEEGREVMPVSYWYKRLLNDTIEIVEPTPPVITEAPSSSPSAKGKKKEEAS